MNDQLERYKARRAACTLPDGTRPYGWWKRYQRRIGGAKMISEAELRRDAERIAKAQIALTGDDK
jgi:hypothetical protein